jgi:Gluconate 2-dehydrogenase subunit 3
MDRRTSLKWMLAASASAPALMRRAAGAAAPSAAPNAGYGVDPPLMAAYQSGQLWPLLLSEAEKRTATVLCDTIIPADHASPSASEVGVVAFIDEWVSAPYPEQLQDRPLVRQGLEWIDARARRDFKRSFADLEEANRDRICGQICDYDRASVADREAARFFARFRVLTAAGFYSTPVGRQDLGYIGNVALASFEGPPPELIRKLGLD